MSCKNFTVETMRRFRLRNRFLYLFICCFCLTSVLLLMGNNEQPTIKTIVTETQKQLSNLKENFREEKRLKVDKVFLHLLGLSEDNPTQNEDKDLESDKGSSATLTVPWHLFANDSGPVIVSAVQSGESTKAVHFLKNVFLFRPESSVILFDMGLGRSEVEFLLQYCNGSIEEGLVGIHTNQSLRKHILRKKSGVFHAGPSDTPRMGRCNVAPFDTFDLFPSHAKNNAFRPILIQQVLRHANCCILWLGLDQRFITDSLNDVLNTAKSSGGVSTWLRENTMPTSSLTHPKMFEYLVARSKVEDYNFQHMVALNALILFSTPEVKQNLMLPWVQCSLLEDCIEPIGAQATGCRFDKKPQFRYSGCHSYDISALNVILGKMFNFNESRYISEVKFFGAAESDELDKSDDKNETSLTESDLILEHRTSVSH